jgi:hypothetical protein
MANFSTTPVESFTIRADIRAIDGSRYIQEALVSFGGASTQPYVIREWRRGDIISPASQLTNSGPAQTCFKL